MWSYELRRTKTRFLDNRLSADGDVFGRKIARNYVVLGYYPNPQVSQSSFQYINENVGQARIKGAEMTLSMALLDGWSFGINGGYTDSKLLSLGAAQNTGYEPGDELHLLNALRLIYNVTCSGTVNSDTRFCTRRRPRFSSEPTVPGQFGESDTIRMSEYRCQNGNE